MREKKKLGKLEKKTSTSIVVENVYVYTIHHFNVFVVIKYDIHDVMNVSSTAPEIECDLYMVRPKLNLHILSFLTQT